MGGLRSVEGERGLSVEKKEEGRVVGVEAESVVAGCHQNNNEVLMSGAENEEPPVLAVSQESPTMPTSDYADDYLSISHTFCMVDSTVAALALGKNCVR